MSDRRTHTIVLASPAARGGSGSSAPFASGRFAEALAFINVTAASGASPTLDVAVEAGPADDEAAFVHTRAARIDAPGKTLLRLSNLGPWLRLSWRVGGEGASFTFGVRLALKT